MTIEPRIDFFSLLIVLGTVQGLILTGFFLGKKNRAHRANVFIGLLMLAFSLISLDIFLCYTGYMAGMAWLDNFSESFTFAIAPLLYCYVFASIRGKTPRVYLIHFLPFLFYFLYNLLYMMQPTGFKYTEYVHAYYPGLTIEPVYQKFNTDPLYLRRFLSEITVLYLFIYIVISFITILKAFRNENVSLFKRHYKNLSWLRNFTFTLFVLVPILVIVKIKFGRDVGDYLISSLIALVLYGTSISVIRTSAFFTDHLGINQSTSRKYAKSSLSEEDKNDILLKLTESMEHEKYYRNNLVSQTMISRKLLIPSHHISQVINEKLNRSFFEFIAVYRIKDAEQMLADRNCDHMTIEDIAEAVGYNSKSAFNKTFKKITGKTPSDYRS